MATARQTAGHVHPVAATHGYCRVSRRPPAPATDTGRILARVGKRNLRRSIPVAIAIATALGKNTPVVSTGVRATAKTVVHPAMTTLRTA